MTRVEVTSDPPSQGVSTGPSVPNGSSIPVVLRAFGDSYVPRARIAETCARLLLVGEPVADAIDGEHVARVASADF